MWQHCGRSSVALWSIMMPELKMASAQEKAMCVMWFFQTKFVITIQRRFKSTYKKDPPSDNSIRRWLKPFWEMGSVLHKKEREDRALPRKASRKCLPLTFSFRDYVKDIV